MKDLLPTPRDWVIIAIGLILSQLLLRNPVQPTHERALKLEAPLSWSLPVAGASQINSTNTRQLQDTELGEPARARWKSR